MFVKHLFSQAQFGRLGVWSANRREDKPMESLVVRGTVERGRRWGKVVRRERPVQ